MRPFHLAGILGAALALGGCGDTSARLSQASQAANDPPAVAPAIISPAEVDTANGPPSYEVGIASAASDRKQAKEKCATLANTERVTCEAEADASFESAQSDLQDLRGNKQ